MKTFAQLLSVACVATCLTGCARDFSMDFSLLSKPQQATDISVAFDQIRLEEGFAVAVMATPLDNSEKMEWETQVELFEVGFDSIFQVERLEFDEEAEERKDRDLRNGDWSFLLTGATTGASQLEVWIDGELETEIPVFVNPQP